ncbi:hypothetical protein FXO38_16621 [Capsicum annuum]|uniref:Rx N-terminal domain-containing protein n=1 Tax=Capsicum annuum TaxID=4072 RepID=A0A2G2YUC2_CAPAN|nr:hypothetical protein FXO37_33237 [Capsicum annuum]KAF3651434.1 hypothetical protein FXO38_16621 [Capsicum annuum]PHT73231.1 hypothetical protein T459_24016 [Capsicum annuum]
MCLQLRDQKVTTSNRNNNFRQKCNIRLGTIDPYGSTILQTPTWTVIFFLETAMPVKSFQVLQWDMAYASVASLMRTMGLVLESKSPMEFLISDHREEFLALHEKVSFLEVFLKEFEKNNTSGKMTDLEAQIKELATIVEHIIQLRLTEIVSTDDEKQKEKIHERLWDSLKQVTEEFDHVQKEYQRNLFKIQVQ